MSFCTGRYTKLSLLCEKEIKIKSQVIACGSRTENREQSGGWLAVQSRGTKVHYCRSPGIYKHGVSVGLATAPSSRRSHWFDDYMHAIDRVSIYILFCS